MTNNRPMVSVLMLTYNHEKYVRQALDSILMQEVNFEYEILISDDCSNDNTREILTEYKKLYPKIIKLFFNPFNIGATRNASKVLKAARGNYIAACEGDDYWTHKHKLQIQVDFLEKNKQFVGCTHLFTVVDENSKPYGNQYLSWVKQKDVFKLDDFQGMFLPGQTATFLRRNLVYDGKIDVEELYKIHSFVGDKTLMLMFLLNGDFALIREKMSCYRKSFANSSSATGMIYRNKLQFLKDDYNIVLILEKFAQNKIDCISFKTGKKIIFTKAVVFAFLKLNYSFLRLAFKIFRESGCDGSFITFIPCYVFSLLKNRI